MKTLISLLMVGTLSLADSTPIPAKRYCRVETYFKHAVAGGICPYWDEVMTGIKTTEPLTVYCARLQAYCRDVDGTTVEVPIEKDPS